MKVYRDGTEDITASFSIDKVPVSDSSEGEGLEVMRYQVFLVSIIFVLLFLFLY